MVIIMNLRSRASLLQPSDGSPGYICRRPCFSTLERIQKLAHEQIESRHEGKVDAIVLRSVEEEGYLRAVKSRQFQQCRYAKTKR